MAKRKKAAAKPIKAAAPVVATEKPPWNVYSTMLLLALLAMILGCVIFTLELQAYDWKTSPTPADVLKGMGN
jgi:hypothetical protein